MRVVSDVITRGELEQMAAALFGDLVKAVVDVDRELIALDAELHADLEALLLEQESAPDSLWGINFYPGIEGDGFLEFDSLINLRPSQGNRSRGVDDEGTRQRIAEVVAKRIRT